MSVSVMEFVIEQKTRLQRFEAYWKENHAINPGQFPLSFENDNAGLWMEQFLDFDEEAYILSSQG